MSALPVQQPADEGEGEKIELSTPEKCTADFCLIPMGTGDPSVSEHIANIQRMIQRTGIKHSMHSAGTTLEGSWEEVTRIIGQCHQMLHDQGVVRINTDIRIGTRTDKNQSFTEKVEVVEELLRSDSGGKGPES